MSTPQHYLRCGSCPISFQGRPVSCPTTLRHLNEDGVVAVGREAAIFGEGARVDHVLGRRRGQAPRLAVVARRLEEDAAAGAARQPIDVEDAAVAEQDALRHGVRVEQLGDVRAGALLVHLVVRVQRQRVRFGQVAHKLRRMSNQEIQRLYYQSKISIGYFCSFPKRACV